MTTAEIAQFKRDHNGQPPCATSWATQHWAFSNTHLCSLVNEHQGQCVCGCGERFTMPEEWKDNRRKAHSYPVVERAAEEKK